MNAVKRKCETILSAAAVELSISPSNSVKKTRIERLPDVRKLLESPTSELILAIQVFQEKIESSTKGSNPILTEEVMDFVAEEDTITDFYQQCELKKSDPEALKELLEVKKRVLNELTLELESIQEKIKLTQTSIVVANAFITASPRKRSKRTIAASILYNLLLERLSPPPTATRLLRSTSLTPRSERGTPAATRTLQEIVAAQEQDEDDEGEEQPIDEIGSGFDFSSIPIAQLSSSSSSSSK